MAGEQVSSVDALDHAGENLKGDVDLEELELFSDVE